MWWIWTCRFLFAISSKWLRSISSKWIYWAKWRIGWCWLQTCRIIFGMFVWIVLSEIGAWRGDILWESERRGRAVILTRVYWVWEALLGYGLIREVFPEIKHEDYFDDDDDIDSLSLYLSTTIWYTCIWIGNEKSVSPKPF